MINKKIKAFEAMEEAQKIAFAPFVFQATVSLRRLGILDYIFEHSALGGVTIQNIASALNLSEYGVGVLLEIANTSNIVDKKEDNTYELTKVGYFLNYNKMTAANVDFTQDICYKGLYHMKDAIQTGKPEGLKELGDWNTIYEGLSQLTPEAQESWFNFDHHYSDSIFEEALPLLFSKKPSVIFDIGGNTGKFAIHCCTYSPTVTLKIFDLPGQLLKALANVKKSGFENRVSGFEIDWLAAHPILPKGADIIWMSQFLDCFSEDEILKILKSCVSTMDDSTELIIVETFTDRQKFENSRFTLEATSLYFTVLANGNSKMYPATVFSKLIESAGLRIIEDKPLGLYHSLLVCKK